jgi:hypothetical protein
MVESSLMLAGDAKPSWKKPESLRAELVESTRRPYWKKVYWKL